MKNVLLYGDINEYSAAKFVETIDNLDTEDICARICTDGGSIDYGWAILTRFKEVTGKKLIKNDGRAYSMGAFAFLYADDREAIDTAEFMLHRAGFPNWIENNSEYFTDEDRARLDRKNKSLRAAFEAKIDVPKFEQITGVKVKDLFSMDGRPEVFLTAAQAKQVGLIDRIVKLTPAKKKEIDAKMQEVTAFSGGRKEAAHNQEKPLIKKAMTIVEFKAENLALYNEVFGLGREAGEKAATEKERLRIDAWAHWLDVDAKKVKEGIASGKDITKSEEYELMEKKFGKKEATAIEDDSLKDNLPTGAAPSSAGKDAKEKEKKDAFIKDVKARSTYFSDAK